MAGLPTNHFKDYPSIIHSMDFVKALDEVVEKARQQLFKQQNVVEAALKKIE